VTVVFSPLLGHRRGHPSSKAQLSNILRKAHPISAAPRLNKDAAFAATSLSLLSSPQPQLGQVCLEEGVSKLANAASRPRRLKPTPTLAQELVGIGFSRCVGEAQRRLLRASQSSACSS